MNPPTKEMMSYHNIKTEIYYIEYSIYTNEVIFVHTFGINDEHQSQGHSYKVFNELKTYGLPIVLECWPTLIEFYNKLGFIKECDTREGYAEMLYSPPMYKILINPLM